MDSTNTTEGNWIQLYGGAKDGLMLPCPAAAPAVICLEGKTYEAHGTVRPQEALESMDLLPGVRFRGHGARPEMRRYVLQGMPKPGF